VRRCGHMKAGRPPGGRYTGPAELERDRRAGDVIPANAGIQDFRFRRQRPGFPRARERRIDDTCRGKPGPEINTAGARLLHGKTRKNQGQSPIFPGRGPRAPGTGCPRPQVPSGQTPERPPRLPAARYPTATSPCLLEEFRHRLDDDPRGDFRPVHEPSEVLPVAGQEMSRLASDRRFKDRAILLR
jgi:hypothetical protein